MINQINLQDRFKQELCTFEWAQKAKAAGLTCANMFFAYDKQGEINDGAWLEAVAFDDYFPCVSFPFACNLIQVPFSELCCHQVVDCYHIEYKGHTFSNKNIVDAVLELWIFTLNEKK